MASFSAILSSLQDDNVQNSKPVPVASRTPVANTNPSKTSTLTASAGLKRKNDVVDTAEPRKSPKVGPGSEKLVASSYQGTLKTAAKPPSKQVPKRTQIPSTQEKPARPGIPPAAPPQAKRGFASLMAKAQAAQEAAKAAGPDTIKHKPTPILSKKDRIRMVQESRMREKQGKTSDASAVKKQTVSGDALAGKPSKEKVVYTGTMRESSSKDTTQSRRQKGAAQDRYGGYASWSDLDAEDDEGEDDRGYYDSESDMEEAGFDEMLDEERQAERIAKLEDQREHEEEERRRKEKIERKRRLQALSSNAAAKKRT